MATGYTHLKTRARSSVKDSDDLNRISCSPCTKDGKETRAVNFCVDCGEFFCSGCIEFHNRITALSFHEVLHEGKMSDYCARGKPSFPTQRCTLHHGRLVDTFCPKHDVVCCTTCVSINHRNCEGIQYIPDVAKGVKDSETFQNLLTSMTTCFKTMDTKKRSYDTELQKTRSKKEKYVHAVERYTENMKNNLDKMKRNAVEEIHSKCHQNEKQVTLSLEKLQDVRSELENAWIKINKDEDNESQIFVNAKSGQNKLAETAAKLVNVEKPEPLPLFFVNFDMHDFLYDQRLGWFGESPTSQAYTLNKSDDINLCDITGSSFHSGTGFILADWANKKLKKVSNAFEVIQSFNVSSCPWGICFIGPDKVAVTFPLIKNVGLFAVETSITEIEYFKVGKTCRGICMKSDQLFIGCDGNKGEGPGHVQVYNLEGKHLFTVKKHCDTAQNIFGFPQHLTASLKHDEIYIADARKGIVIIKSNGTVVKTVNQESTCKSKAICTNEANRIFVTDDTNGRILQLSNDLNVCTEIENKDDPLLEVQSLVYDASKARLVATIENANFILVYKLK